jgi:transcription antitermination protein NusB
MLNRRHIRAKVMQVLYAQTSNTTENLNSSVLKENFENMYSLYLVLLSLFIKLRQRAQDHQQKAKQKMQPTYEDANPNMRFIENLILVRLVQSEALKSKLEFYKIDFWEQDGEYIELFFQEMIQSDLYKLYMNSPTSSFENDVNFVVELFKQIIVPNEKLYDYFEDKNLTWIDDLPVVNTALVKLFSKFNKTSPDTYFTPLLFRDKDDEKFGISLYNKTFKNKEKFKKEIISYTKNWDKDRISSIDFVLLQMAICEIQEFPTIPTKVTINEYIELAKEYSTPKSNVFINGILDKIVRDYKDNKTLNKKGRGLI